MTIIENKSIFAKIFYNAWGFLYRKLINENKISLVGVASNCYKFLSKKYKISLDKINLIPLGVDTDLFCPDEAKRVKMRKNLI